MLGIEDKSKEQKKKMTILEEKFLEDELWRGLIENHKINTQLFQELNDIVNKLRNPGGAIGIGSNCKFINSIFHEEVYELIDGIDKKDSNNIKEELGDVLLHIIFQSQIASEKNLFTINDVINDINEKLIKGTKSF